MEILRNEVLGERVHLQLIACDQYNDYSVVYDYFIVVNGKRHKVGTNKFAATQQYETARRFCISQGLMPDRMRVGA